MGCLGSDLRHRMTAHGKLFDILYRLGHRDLQSAPHAQAMDAYFDAM